MKPYYDDSGVTLYHGDARALPIADESVQTCVTSPPYWGLRDYGVGGQLGLEPTPEEYVVNMVAVFREVRRVLRTDGTLWLNLGDTYASIGRSDQKASPKGTDGQDRGRVERDVVWGKERFGKFSWTLPGGQKPKDLIGIPWMVALALRADGWYLRSDIIWHKPNPMPESVTDRPTKSHEYLFLLSKSEAYFYDADAIAEQANPASALRYEYAFGGAKAEHLTAEEASGPGTRTRPIGWRQSDGTRNARSVWTINTAPYPGAHFATFPPTLPERCILAGSKPGDLVLDPFNGSGTTGEVAQRWGRRYVGVDLNADYLELSKQRFRQGVLFAPGRSA